MSLRQMVLLMLGFYAVAIGLGLFLAAYTTFWPVFWLGVAGVFISVFYTAPPFRFVHRGVGEVMVGLGFGPIMTMGAYYVQARGWSWEAFYLSLPVAFLIALVLYVNEVPDRPGDAAAGKRTLPVRLSKEAVIAAYIGCVAVAFGLIAGGALAGVIVRPAILALVAMPLAAQVYRGLRQHYESPYQLMPFMGKGVQLHLATGLLLLAGYVIAIVASHMSGHPPVFLR
jgi:1,4-dihydroxy-2-naphthoate octaprenyltransferase